MGEKIRRLQERNAMGAAVAVRNLAEVLEDVAGRHPDVRLQEFDERGPRATWDINDLAETVKRDLAAMTALERARADVNRYFWGYDADGMIEVVYAPTRGAPVRQFLQVPGAAMGSIFDIFRERELPGFLRMFQPVEAPRPERPERPGFLRRPWAPEEVAEPKVPGLPSAKAWEPRVRPTGVRRGPARRREISEWFDLEKNWERIRGGRNRAFMKAVRESKETGEYARIPLTMIAKAGSSQQARIADFFEVPSKEFGEALREGTWEQALARITDDLMKELNAAKPSEFPGFLDFVYSDEGDYRLFYLEGLE